MAAGSSRRQFVAMLLGAPFALACREREERLPDGELLLPGKVAGHRLRDGLAHGKVAPAHWRETTVAIVGAGAAGLAAAWWLARSGVEDVLVLELDAKPGGTSQSDASAVSAYPWGAHYIVAPSAEQASLVALLDELGALEGSDAAGQPRVSEQTLCRELEERVFFHGRWYDGLYLRPGASPQDLAELERFQHEVGRWVAFRDGAGRRAFALPASAASVDADVAALDRVSFGAWLEQLGLRSPRLRWLCDYACRDDYGLLAADTSAWAGIGYFASRMAAPDAEPQPVVTWPEGNGRLIAALGKRLGPRLLLEHAVASVRQSPSGVELTALAPGGPVGVRAKRAIIAAPRFVSERIVSGLSEARPRLTLDHGAWAVANLHLSGRPRAKRADAPLAWDNVFYDSPSLGYVVATHQAGKDYGPTVLTWYYPFTGDGASARRALDGATRADWAAVALADIGRAHPDIRELCTRIDVAYWGHGMARPRPGTIFDPALRAARAPLAAVHFAASELSGMSLFEEALDHGVRAASEVMRALGHRV